MKIIVIRPFEVEVNQDGHTITGLSKVFGPKGAPVAFFLGRTLYVKDKAKVPELEELKMMPSIQVSADEKLFEDLLDILTVDDVLYFAHRDVERRQEQPDFAKIRQEIEQEFQAKIDGLNKLHGASEKDLLTRNQELEARVLNLGPENERLRIELGIPSPSSPISRSSEINRTEVGEKAENENELLENAFKFVMAQLFMRHQPKGQQQQGETPKIFEKIAEAVDDILRGIILIAGDSSSEKEAQIVVDYFKWKMNIKEGDDFTYAIESFKEHLIKEFLPQFLRDLFDELPGDERVKKMQEFEEAYKKYLAQKGKFAI